jgi:hypothetical protein
MIIAELTIRWFDRPNLALATFAFSTIHLDIFSLIEYFANPVAHTSWGEGSPIHFAYLPSFLFGCGVGFGGATAQIAKQ